MDRWKSRTIDSEKFPGETSPTQNEGMALGNNRDYKTRGRRAQRNLRIHFELMKPHLEAGLDKEAASSLAYGSLTTRDGEYEEVRKRLGYK